MDIRVGKVRLGIRANSAGYVVIADVPGSPELFWTFVYPDAKSQTEALERAKASRWVREYSGLAVSERV